MGGVGPKETRSWGGRGGIDKRGGHEGNAGNKNADIQVSFSTSKMRKRDEQQKHTRARTKKNGNPS